VLTLSSKINDKGDITDIKVRAGIVRNMVIVSYDAVDRALNLPPVVRTFPFGGEPSIPHASTSAGAPRERPPRFDVGDGPPNSEAVQGWGFYTQHYRSVYHGLPACFGKYWKSYLEAINIHGGSGILDTVWLTLMRGMWVTCYSGGR